MPSNIFYINLRFTLFFLFFSFDQITVPAWSVRDWRLVPLGSAKYCWGSSASCWSWWARGASQAGQPYRARCLAACCLFACVECNIWRAFLLRLQHNWRRIRRSSLCCCCCCCYPTYASFRAACTHCTHSRSAFSASSNCRRSIKNCWPRVAPSSPRTRDST